MFMALGTYATVVYFPGLLWCMYCGIKNKMNSEKSTHTIAISIQYYTAEIYSRNFQQFDTQKSIWILMS